MSREATVWRGAHPVAHVVVANTAWTRLRGLLGRSTLADDQGVLLMPCTSVHMMFMRFAVDVVYLDDELRIVKIVPQLRPWRFSAGGGGACHALELAAGAAERLALRVGDALALTPTSIPV
jgi:uncharacterized membrane protein (UPF0127 family)